MNSEEIYAQLASSTPNIENVSLVANQEKEFTFPNTVRKFSLQCRDNLDIKIAVKKGETATKYFTLKSTGVWFEDFIKADNLTLYFLSSSNTTIEIIWWY